MDSVENYRSTMPEAVLRDWAQDAQKELVSLRARIDELSLAYAVQGLAIEELTAERDRYREALEWIVNCTDSEMGDGDGARKAARAALKELTK